MEVETICKAIKNSFPGAEIVYTRGCCFEFYKILKSIFPQALPFYDFGIGHVYTKIDGEYYDIHGKAFIDFPLTLMEDHSKIRASKWKSRQFGGLDKVIENFIDSKTT